MNLIRTLPALAAAVGAALALTASAAADPPTKDVWTATFSFSDDETCPGITINWSFEERNTFIVFSPTRQHFQTHGVATLTANGKTVTQNFNATLIIDPTASVVQVAGTVFNIQAPGVGNLLVDAGNLVLDVSTSPPTVLHIGGPHPQFFGDVAGLCGYLADP